MDSFTTLKIPRISAIQSLPPLHKTIYTLNAIATKIPKAFFAETEKSTLKFTWNLKGPQKAKKFLQRNNVAQVTSVAYH